MRFILNKAIVKHDTKFYTNVCEKHGPCTR
jgi:hypothetical protein